MHRHHWGRARFGRDDLGMGGHGREFGHGHRGWGRESMGGGRRGRVFDQGDLRLVILQLIAERPSHGYELIKAIEERLGGAYTPSPGVVYPTLTLLEEMGYATVDAAEGGRKLYTITDSGREVLEDNRATIEAIRVRMSETRARGGDVPPQVLRAMENLKTAVRLKLSQGATTADQACSLAEAIDAAALAVERV